MATSALSPIYLQLSLCMVAKREHEHAEKFESSLWEIMCMLLESLKILDVADVLFSVIV
jgi:hypothetical protein